MNDWIVHIRESQRYTGKTITGFDDRWKREVCRGNYIHYKIKKPPYLLMHQ